MTPIRTPSNRARCALAIVAMVLFVPHGAHAADPAKVLRISLTDITSLDPQQGTDLYSTRVAGAIFEALYQFDYLATPAKVIPNTAAAMPEITDGGRTWTIRLQTRHPLRRRSGVQGQAARARRRRLRLLDQALARSRSCAAAAIRRSPT